MELGVTSAIAFLNLASHISPGANINTSATSVCVFTYFVHTSQHTTF